MRRRPTTLRAPRARAGQPPSVDGFDTDREKKLVHQNLLKRGQETVQQYQQNHSAQPLPQERIKGLQEKVSTSFAGSSTQTIQQGDLNFFADADDDAGAADQRGLQPSGAQAEGLSGAAATDLLDRRGGALRLRRIFCAGAGAV